MESKGLIFAWEIASWAAVLIAFYCMYEILKAWILVADDPHMTLQQSIQNRMGITLAAMLIGIVAAFVAKSGFRKSDKLRGTK
ncbi:MAG TPA: hypothetical protein VGJ21_10885 [Terracidiphilus sp.]|jgi:hypothetical protein